MSDIPSIRLKAISEQIAPKEAEPFYLPQDVPFNAHRPLRAIIVGAGIAGISAAVLLPNKVPNLSYTLYEKNGLVVRALQHWFLVTGMLTRDPERNMG